MKTTILKQTKIIEVLTPIPYKVVTYINSTMDEVMKVQKELDEAVLFLRDCFKLLRISNNEAIKNQYTLNIDTGQRLYKLAIEKHRVGKLSHEMLIMIRNYDW